MPIRQSGTWVGGEMPPIYTISTETAKKISGFGKLPHLSSHINQKKSLSFVSRKENNLSFWYFTKLNLNRYFIKIFNWQIFKSRMFSNVTIMLFVNHDILVVLFLHSALIITQKSFNLKESPYIFLKFVLFTTCPSPYKYTYLNSYSLDAIH